MKRVARLSLAIALGAVLAPLAVAAPARTTIQGVGFQTPESVLHDASADVYLVSNINGNPTGTDNNGFISRVAPSGRVLSLKWIAGGRAGVTLNAPKGMAVAGGTLYVTDITVVRMFDRATGRPTGAIPIPGATFLNDLAAGPDGSVYVTDSGLKPDFSPSGTDAVYRIDRMGKVTTIAKDPNLHGPNGIAVLPGGALLVVTFSQQSELYTLAPDGTRRALPALPAGQLDGVELLPDGSYLVSSWAASTVFRASPDGTAKAVVEGVRAPADIGYDRRRRQVLIPMFMDSRVVVVRVP